MHKRDLSPVERIKEPPEKFLKTFSSPTKFIGEGSPTESTSNRAIETFEILPQCKSNVEAAKERLNGACREERNKKNYRIQMEQDNRKRKSEYILKMVKKKQLHQRPPDSLLDLIIKAITSAPEGYVTFSNIYKYIADKYPFYQEKSHWWKKCIQVTLKRNRTSFIHIPASRGNRSLQNDIWTIHPLAAAKFVNSQNKIDSRKESHEDILLNQETIQNLSQDESVPEKCEAAENPGGTEQSLKKPTHEVTKRPLTCDARVKLIVKIERSNLIDRLATVYKRTQINNSQSKSSTKTKEITNANSKEEWRGWPEPCFRLEDKRKLVQSIVEETKSVLTSSFDHDVMEDEEIVPYEPEMHKEQEYVTKGCQQTQNLISSLLKAVEVLDRKKQALEQEEAAITLKQMQEGSGFIGFDHDLWSGPWRGWERAMTRRRDQLLAYVSRMAGSLDLATVLADCRLAVNSMLQELEKHEINSKDGIKKDKRKISSHNEEKYLVEKIQSVIKDLMKCISNRSSEPPFSYTVLTVMALASSLDTSLPVTEIHRFIEDLFPFYRGHSEGSWKDSIELILRLNNTFVKACQGPCGRKSPDHRGCWRVDAKSAEDILGRALHREIEIQKKNLQYKQSKENKENNNCNRTAVLDHGEVKEKTAKTGVNLNNVVNSDGHQKGMRRNSVIVSTFDLEKSTKQGESEHLHGKEFKKLELSDRKTLTFETKIDRLIVNASQDSCSDSETSLNSSEVGHSSANSGNNSSNLSVNSHKITDSSGNSSTVSERILALAARVKILDVCETSVPQNEQSVATNTCAEESFISISSEEDPENNILSIHSMQYSVKDVDHVTDETGSTSVVTSSDQETPSEDERTPPETTITKTVGNSRNISVCQMCDKQFSCSFLFDHHLCFHPLYSSFACYICHVMFDNSCLLRDHLNSLHGGAHNHHRVSTLCLSNDPDRSEHDLVTVESRYKCTACLAVFHSKHKLDTHKEMVHSNIITFECNFCRPAQLFRNKINFQLHLATRHPSNYPLPYICQMCKARFSAEDHLNQHIVIFHQLETEPLPAKSKSHPLEDLLFICHMCHTCFKSKQSLLSHSCSYKG